ncbi:MAG: FAD-dependent oxidoreductase [Clostridia bacterium]|nr:FAD-dependent oxidoreductase [Clostridia bacterium]
MGKDNMYDVIIIGGGPAGLSAAIYLARAKYKVLVMEQAQLGGQITITSEIVNYPGVFKTSGKQLTEQMRLQGKAFGAEYLIAKAEKVELSGDVKTVITDTGREFKALGIVLALGASPRKLGFEGEKEFQGRGVAYCATCDGEFFTGREVLVVGGGFAAAEEAMFLTKYASKVTIIVRKGEFSCAQSVVDKLAEYPKIEVRYFTEVIEAGGKGVLTHATLKNNQTGETYTYEAADGGNFGIFVFVGYAPATDLVAGQVELSKQGYIITDVNQKTSIDGVYAAGDVCIKNLRQVVTAVSDGATAATSLEKHVSTMHEKLGLGPFVQEKDEAPVQAEAAEEQPKKKASSSADAFISEDIKAQLRVILNRFARKATIVVMNSGDAAGIELSGFAEELKGVHDMLEVGPDEKTDGASYIDIRTEDGPAGIRYYSVPGGHEFNSFVIALYNAAGPGQPMGQDLKNRIASLGKHTLSVMATLSCTNCPDVVMGTQRIASLNPGITAEMYDLSKFPEIKSKYNIMAVPCLIIDGTATYFGKQNLESLVEIVEKSAPAEEEQA